MVAPAADPDCVGHHLGQPFAGYRKIKWFSSTHWAAPGMRVREHTCSCQNVAYEFGMSGAGFVIQRTIRAADGVCVERTMPMSWAEAHDLWLSIFQGTAR